MKIAVCMKEVPDTMKVKIDRDKGTLIRSGVPSILNPFDVCALECALQIKDDNDSVRVIVISMGPPNAERNLREPLAMGADEIYLVTDEAFSGADTYATSYTIAAAIKHIGKIDVILTGKQAIDGDTAQIGPGIAEWLKIPQIAFTRRILKIDNGKAFAERSTENGYDVVEAELPVLLTIIKSDTDPRLPTLHGMMRAKKTKIKRLSVNELLVDRTKIGLAGSPTQVKRIFNPPPRTGGIVFEGNPKEVVEKLVVKLEEMQLL